MRYVVVLPNNSYKPFTNTAWVSAGLVNYKKMTVSGKKTFYNYHR
jgi:hypothetical protein